MKSKNDISDPIYSYACIYTTKYLQTNLICKRSSFHIFLNIRQMHRPHAFPPRAAQARVRNGGNECPEGHNETKDAHQTHHLRGEVASQRGRVRAHVAKNAGGIGIIFGCFLKWWENPHFTPQVLIIFSRKTHGFVGETHHFRKPPYEPWEPTKVSSVLGAIRKLP